MTDAALIHAHRQIQSAATQVLAELAESIGPDDTERTLAARAHAALTALGLPDTWYYACPAFVLLGSRSCLSVSGRDYEPANEPVGEHNLVTIDLSPTLDGHWGDCARSFCIENGRVSAAPQSTEFSSGIAFLSDLHADMRRIATPDMRFGELFAWSNARIVEAEFENLDFLGNVGHSIATRREDRQFIERDNPARLGDVPFFTFEPHVRQHGGKWGFKHEDIFFFNPSGVLEVL